MYLLVCLSLLGTALAVPITNDVTTRDHAAQYVLPSTTYPTFYDVSLILDPRNTEYFVGNTSIRILAREPVTEIVMHAMELEIHRLIMFDDLEPERDLVQSFTVTTDDTQFLRITVSEALVPLRLYTIRVDYTGKYADNMFGIYVSTYEENGQPRSLITSQLQPTFARRAFPCYDEPSFKAIFRTTIYAPEEYPVVRSNTDLRNDTLKDEIDGYVKHEFEDTLVMSTYLIAYLVSNFDYIDNRNNVIYRVPFRVYSRPGTQNTAAFALEFGQKNMAALEEYIEFDYEFSKLDKVAVPDFAAGAMENWGLIIYREVALLVQEGVTTTNVKQNIGRIICHENMHQWFGNEVSPVSWTYTWLNEGFANFFENYATDLVLPEWRMMDQFVIALQNVFQSDAVLSVNPMTHPVYTPSEIIGTFNAVAYQKSGSVIRMMQHFLTPEVFRQGLIRYIRTYSRAAVVPSNLYASLQEGLDASVHSIPYNLATILERWTTQGGFPLVTVNRQSPFANSVSVTQRRYLTDPNQSSTDQWHIPLNWVLSTDVDFTDTSPQGWLPPANIAQAIDIPGLQEAEWYIFNKQQTGYYRVNYDNSNWEALAEVLSTNHSLIHVLNRAQLLDDAFNLARTGNLEYDYAFDLSTYLDQEKDYIPWAAVNPAFTYLDMALSGTLAHDLFKTYLFNITAPLFAELGFHVGDNEEHVTPYHRNIILDLNCRHGNPDCIETASQLLQEFRNDPTQRLNPDIQTTVYCSGLRGGDVENFNFLWNQYLNTADSSEQSILLNSLGCTSNVERRTFYMNQVIDDNSSVREQDRHSILVSVINSSPENMEAALDFIIEHWPEIQPRVQGLTGTTNILTAFSRRLTTEAHRAKMDEFVSRHESIFSAGEVAMVAATSENINAAITWSEQNVETVQYWLQQNYGEENDDGSGDNGEDGSGDNGEDGSGDNGEDGSGDNGEDGSGDNGEDNGADVVTASSVLLLAIVSTIINY